MPSPQLVVLTLEKVTRLSAGQSVLKIPKTLPQAGVNQQKLTVTLAQSEIENECHMTGAPAKFEPGAQSPVAVADVLSPVSVSEPPIGSDWVIAVPQASTPCALTETFSNDPTISVVMVKIAAQLFNFMTFKDCVSAPNIDDRLYHV